ncbi:MAG: hypothetical protein A3C58_03270, partial [Candidatus Staskawiczbacteria bacterium RIFCSPHIGHO2_02_FULL_34_10]
VKKYGIKKFVQISCYDEKTRAVTKDGLKYYYQLSENDEVLTLNEQRQPEFQKIEKMIIQDYEGEMVRFGGNADMLVTPNHRMYDENMKVYEAISIEKKFQFPKSKVVVSEEKKTVSVDGIGEVNAKDLLYVLGVFIGDGFTAYQEKIQVNKSGLSRKEFINRKDKNGRFIAGKTGNKETALSKSYRIFFDVPENDKARIRLEQSLTNLGLKWTAQRGKSGEHIYFTSKELLKFFDVQVGKGAKNKRIPSFIWSLGKKNLTCLYDGLMDSDGYYGKTSTTYTTVGNDLMSDVALLCFLMGKRVSNYYKYSNCEFEGRIIKGGANQLTITEGVLATKVINKESYRGKVWCVTVKNKNFLIERNGKFAFSGNTDEVYGSIEKGSFRETDPLNPSSPYSAAKAGADLLALSYFKTYNLPVSITRCSNNFGPFQYPEKLIPLFITNILENKKIPVYGDGMNVRNWIYVKDHCEAIDIVLHSGENGQIYNIGSSHEKSNLEITHAILKELKRNTDDIQYVQDRPGHDRRYSLNCEKIKNELGWQSKYDFNKALTSTIQWYKDNKEWWEKIKSNDYTAYYKK